MRKSVLLLVSSALSTSLTAQLPCWNPNLGTSLGLSDEDISVGQPLGFTFTYNGVAYTDIQVCDNGYITLGATGGDADWDPWSQTLVTDPFPRICPLWTDLDPSLTSNGDVLFNAVPAAGNVPAHAVVTWLDCWEYAGMTPHTFQVVLIDGGGIRCSYGADLAANTSTWLIGASPGNGAALNPVSFAALPILTAGNATFHEEDAIGSPIALAGDTLDWAPDGIGGYVITQTTGCGAVDSYGAGCVGEYRSFYEWFTSTPAIDLSNSAFQLLFTGTTYVVAPSTTVFTAPSPAASNLNLDNDNETSVALSSALSYPGGTTSTLNVCSNGHISVASNGAGSDYMPLPQKFLAWPFATWAVWRDFFPGPLGGGDVWFEEIGNLSIITWLDVLGYNAQVVGTTPSSHQIVFDRSTGNVEFVFGQLDTVSVNTWPGAEGWVVGFTPAGQSLDPGSVDISAAIAGGSIALSDIDVLPLGLASSALPSAGSTIDLDVTGITATAPFGGVLFGLVRHDPGLSLAGIGMPGCFQHNDMLAVVLFFPNGASSVQIPFAVPPFPGVPIQAQAALLDRQAARTPLGGTASNGLELLIGQ